MNIMQRILGIGNTQNIFVNSNTNLIDIMPQDIEKILDIIIKEGPSVLEDWKLKSPDLKQKNKLNGVNGEQFNLISEDVLYFADIEESIRSDESGTLKNKYKNAARILNLQYMNKFQKRFSDFVIQVVKTFSEQGKITSDSLVKLVALLHYMYYECDLGIKP